MSEYITDWGTIEAGEILYEEHHGSLELEVLEKPYRTPLGQWWFLARIPSRHDKERRMNFMMSEKSPIYAPRLSRTPTMEPVTRLESRGNHDGQNVDGRGKAGRARARQRGVSRPVSGAQ